MPLPRHIGDKVHAYVRIHPNGRVSSRAKDLVDLALALEHVFANRNEALPSSFPPPPAHWERSYPAIAEGIAVPGDYMDAHKIVATMLDPVLRNTVDPDYRWDPVHQRWVSPGNRGI